jgi:hypothetical protein
MFYLWKIQFYTGYDDVVTVVIRYKYVKDITLTMKAYGTVGSWHIDIDNLFRQQLVSAVAIRNKAYSPVLEMHTI